MDPSSAVSVVHAPVSSTRVKSQNFPSTPGDWILALIETLSETTESPGLPLKSRHILSHLKTLMQQGQLTPEHRKFVLNYLQKYNSNNQDYDKNVLGNGFRRISSQLLFVWPRLWDLLVHPKKFPEESRWLGTLGLKVFNTLTLIDNMELLEKISLYEMAELTYVLGQLDLPELEKICKTKLCQLIDAEPSLRFLPGCPTAGLYQLAPFWSDERRFLFTLKISYLGLKGCLPEPASKSVIEQELTRFYKVLLNPARKEWQHFSPGERFRFFHFIDYKTKSCPSLISLRAELFSAVLEDIKTKKLEPKHAEALIHPGNTEEEKSRIDAAVCDRGEEVADEHLTQCKSLRNINFAELEKGFDKYKWYFAISDHDPSFNDCKIYLYLNTPVSYAFLMSISSIYLILRQDNCFQWDIHFQPFKRKNYYCCQELLVCLYFYAKAGFKKPEQHYEQAVMSLQDLCNRVDSNIIRAEFQDWGHYDFLSLVTAFSDPIASHLLILCTQTSVNTPFFGIFNGARTEILANKKYYTKSPDAVRKEIEKFKEIITCKNMIAHAALSPEELMCFLVFLLGLDWESQPTLTAFFQDISDFLVSYVKEKKLSFTSVSLLLTECIEHYPEKKGWLILLTLQLKEAAKLTGDNSKTPE